MCVRLFTLIHYRSNQQRYEKLGRVRALVVCRLRFCPPKKKRLRAHGATERRTNGATDTPSYRVVAQDQKKHSNPCKISCKLSFFGQRPLQGTKSCSMGRHSVRLSVFPSVCQSIRPSVPPLAGPQTLLAGPQTLLAGSQTPPAGPQNPPASPQTTQASPQPPLTSPQTPQQALRLLHLALRV